MALQLTLNAARNEMISPGWCRTILAQNMIPAKRYIYDQSSYLPDPEGFTSNTKLWHEPLTGAVMLRPNFLTQKFWNSVDYEGDKFDAGDFTYGLGALYGLPDDFETIYQQNIGGVPCSPIMVTKHGSAGGVMQNMNTLATLTLHGSTGGPVYSLVGVDTAEEALPWCYLLRTKREFIQNEGFAFQLLPRDLQAASIFPYLMVYFGGKYCLQIGTDGQAELWMNVQGKSDTWLRLAKCDYNHTMASEAGSCLNVMILPFYGYHLGIYMSSGQENAGWFGAFGGDDPSPASRFFIQCTDLKDINGNELNPSGGVDPSTGLIPITQRDNITFAGRKDSQFALSFAQIRYPAAGTLYLAAEHIGMLRPDEDPVIETRKFKDRGDVVATSLQFQGFPWDKSVDVKLMPKVEFTAGTGYPFSGWENDRVYSPQLALLTAFIEPRTESVARTSENFSAKWQTLAFRGATEDDGAVLDFTSAPNEANYYDKGFTTVDLTVTDGMLAPPVTYALFGGVIDGFHTRHDVERPFASFSARDHWDILEKTYTWDSPVWDGRLLKEAVVWLLKQAGFHPNDIYVQPGALGITIPNTRRAGEYSHWQNEAESVADQLRRMLALSKVRIRPGYAPDGVIAEGGNTLTRANFCWEVMSLPQYTSSAQVVAKFWNDRPVGFPFPAESVRFAAAVPDLYCKALERDVRPPLYNILHLDAPTGSGKDAKRTMITHVNQASISDPAHKDYLGRAIRGYVYPGGHSAGPDDLVIYAREREREDMHSTEIASWDGEWRPKLREWDFVEIFARNTVTRQIVSFGVYQILERSLTLNIELGYGLDTHYVGKYVGAGDAYTDPGPPL